MAELAGANGAQGPLGAAREALWVGAVSGSWFVDLCRWILL